MKFKLMASLTLSEWSVCNGTEFQRNLMLGQVYLSIIESAYKITYLITMTSKCIDDSIGNGNDK